MTIFQQYEKHRALLLEEFVGILMKIPSAGKSSRLFTAVDAQNEVFSVRMSTVLLLKYLQASCWVDPESIGTNLQVRYRGSISLAGVFIKVFSNVF